MRMVLAGLPEHRAHRRHAEAKVSYMMCHDESESEGGADTDMVGIAVVACSRGSGSKSDLWRLARLIGATDHPSET